MKNSPSLDQGAEVGAKTAPTLRGHLRIARIDHWFKNVFVLPGTITALALDPEAFDSELPIRLLIGLFATCLIASSNYVINEVLDAPFDRHHPDKRHRPVPSGQVSVPVAYLQWVLLGAAGVMMGALVSAQFVAAMVIFWLMGCIYNIPPVRSKDLPYLDVVSEAFNNPLRMFAGWYIVVTTTFPPWSLLFSYWMVGCYFMAMKRYAEYRDIGHADTAAAYRKSFRYYSEERLLISIMFYGTAAMLFFGAFIMRYRLELILSFPLIALIMALYLALAFKRDSPVQRPEGLYREPTLMAALSICVLFMGILLFVDLPFMHAFFDPTAATNPEAP